MKILYTDKFKIPLPARHSFPIQKYFLLRKRIVRAALIPEKDLGVPPAATQEEILRAHDPVYVHRLEKGELTTKEMRRIGLPWSVPLVERAKRSAGATLEACRAALQEKIAVNLAGGTHHAFRDRGEGYCLLNDSVIAARTLQARNFVRSVLIIDCDVHQGNGTAAILAQDPTIFTFSIHGRNNFPYHKEKSDLDIALDDGTEDTGYLEALQKGLDQVFERTEAELAIYLAGADPYADDRFGRLALSKAGLAARDQMVFQYCLAAEIPVAVTMAGGYAPQIEDTVDIHLQTVRIALEMQQASGSRRMRLEEKSIS
ncbi:MAG: histone deacetylase [Desulfobacterales bacterium]|nr:MAG: histone deacetylase [Desulfobacterales bacterium]